MSLFVCGKQSRSDESGSHGLELDGGYNAYLHGKSVKIANDAAGGAVFLSSSDIASSGTSGEIVLTTGTSSGGNTGGVRINTGLSSGLTGNIDIAVGQSMDTASGSIRLASGDSENGEAGDLNLLSGSSSVNKGGDIYIHAGQSTSHESGGIYLATKKSISKTTNAIHLIAGSVTEHTRTKYLITNRKELVGRGKW